MKPKRNPVRLISYREFFLAAHIAQTQAALQKVLVPAPLPPPRIAPQQEQWN